METPIPEVHTPSYLCPDPSGVADDQHLGADNVRKYEETLGVPRPSEYYTPFRIQDVRELVPYCIREHGVPASWLHGYPAPTTLPSIVFLDSPIQVQPVIVMQKVSIDSLKQQVHTLWGKDREIMRFPRGGGHVPPCRCTSTVTILGISSAEYNIGVKLSLHSRQSCRYLTLYSFSAVSRAFADI